MRAFEKNPYENKIKRCFFSIIGDFDPEEISNKLFLTPDAILRPGDHHPYDGCKVEKCEIIYGYNDLYEIDYNDMLYKTLEGLLPKEKLLAELKEQYNLTYKINVGKEMADELLVLDGPISGFIVWIGASKEQNFNFF